MRLAMRLPRVSLKRLLLRSLTLGLLLVAMLPFTLDITSQASFAQTTTTTPCSPMPTNPLTSSPDAQTWAVCQTQHDTENLRADALFGLALLVTLSAAMFGVSLWKAAK